MASFKTSNGKTVKDGAEVELVFLYRGSGDVADAEVVRRGTVRRFEQVERVYDDEGIAVGKTTEERWELLVDDPEHPAVGILPENVLVRSDS